MKKIFSSIFFGVAIATVCFGLGTVCAYAFGVCLTKVPAFVCILIAMAFLCVVANEARQRYNELVDIEKKEMLCGSSDDDGNVIATVEATTKNPLPIIDALALTTDWKEVCKTICTIEDKYDSMETDDPILADLKNEEIALRERFKGALVVAASETFEEWSDADKVYFIRQLFGMNLYHSMVFTRAKRYGLLIEKDEEA